MGLDTTHDCWSGSYSGFGRWRAQLHAALTGGKKTLDRAWLDGDYDDQSVPINVLMNHSDCDGEIAAQDCGPLADALEALLPKLDDSDPYLRGRTEQFINGLRDAAAANEPVEFQ